MILRKPKSKIKDCKPDCGCAKGRVFRDKLTYDKEAKKVISVRDGYMTYLGAELGVEPADAEVRVYRSADTLKKLKDKMGKLSIKEDHIDDNPTIGEIQDSEILEYKEENTDTTLVMQHNVLIYKEAGILLESGTREVSLDYIAEIVQRDDGEYEQLNIEPKYLAIVDNGRCGEVCKFQDKEGTSMEKLTKVITAIKDADKDDDKKADITLSDVSDIMAALPDAMQGMSIEKLKEVVPYLKEMMTVAEPVEDEDYDEDKKDVEDSDDDDKDDKDEKDEKKSVKDEKKATADGITLFDKDHLRKFVDSTIQERDGIIERARKFVDSTYVFGGKSNKDIITDVLKLEGEDVKDFKDSELEVAFKLLKDKKKEAVTKVDGGFISYLGKEL